MKKQIIISIVAGLLAPLIVLAVVLFPYQGGTGTGTVPTAGKILIGTSGGIYSSTYLTAGTNITIATSSGAITITSTAVGTATTTINNVSGPTFTFATSSDTNIGLVISTSTGQLTFTSQWIGTLADTRIVSASNWNTAYGWGNHALGGYATTGTSGLTNYYTSSYIGINYLATSTAASTYYLQTNPSGYITDGNTGWDNSYGLITATTTSLTGYYTTSTINTNFVSTSTALSTYFTIAGANASNTSWLADTKWTGVSTDLVAATGRTSLGLGDSAILASSTWAKVANNLSDLSNISTAQTNLGLVIGTNVQAYDANNATTGTALSVFAGSVTDGQVPDTITLTNITQITNRALSNLSGTLAIASTTGILTYTQGGTGTSTALALQNLWWGNGSGGLVQVASSTLAGAGGVSSLNTLTGALTLWGTTNQLTVNASGTVGLTFNIGTNVATTGIATLSSLSSVGTITTGAWQGTAIADAYIPNNITIDLSTAATALAANPTDCSANQYANAIAASGNLTCSALADADIPDTITIVNNATTGVATLSSLLSIGTITTGTWSATAIANTKGGTGQDTSGWSGVPKLSSGTWATSTTLIKKTITANFNNATTTSGLNTYSSYNADISVPILAGCQTAAGTSTVGIQERTGAFTPTSNFIVLSCSTTIATSSAFAPGSILAGNFISFTLTGLTSASSTQVWLVKTITP